MAGRHDRDLLCDFDALPARDRNHARWIFLDPAARELYLDWETVARENVAILRMDAGRHPDEQTLFIYSVEPRSASAQALDLLGNWTAAAPACATETADDDQAHVKHPPQS